MADDAEPRRLITPPPGLLPPARSRETDAPVNTGSETRKLSRTHAPPTFFPAGSRAPEDTVLRGDLPATTARVWVVELRDGTRHEIPERGLAVGRNPSAPDAAPDAALLAVDDPERSVSKTHALLRLVSDAVTVVDLASTNGVAIAGDRITQGVEREVPEGATVAFGSYPVLIERRPS